MTEPDYEWARAEERALARFVQPAALPPEWGWPKFINRLDLLLADGPGAVAAELYRLMSRAAIQYDLAPFTPRAGVTQRIRTPGTILAEKRGTCLDLTVSFAALCLANDLLPLVVVVDGHAFAGLSLIRTRQDARRAPRPHAWDKGLLADLSVLQELAGQEYLFVETTGAAQSQSLSSRYPEGRGRGSTGLMSFERACDAGQEQVRQHLHALTETGSADQRAFLFALDVHDLQINHGFEPLEAGPSDAGGQPGAGQQVQSGTGNIQFGAHARVEGDVFTGNKHVDTGGGDMVGRDKVTHETHGDTISVGSASGTGIAIGRDAQATVTAGSSGSEIDRLFAGIYRHIDARPPDEAVDKTELTDTVRRIEQETGKGEAASEPRLERWLQSLGAMAPDILEVTVAALTSPLAAISTVVRKVAEKARSGA